jgi:predicted DNA repair protein MutK
VAAPWLMKGLSVAGTAAMFLVGGGILTHGLTPLHHAIERLEAALDGVLGPVTPLLVDAAVGVLAGAVVLAVVTLARNAWAAVRPRPSPAAPPQGDR